jgi:hypothetical protein
MKYETGKTATIHITGKGSNTVLASQTLIHAKKEKKTLLQHKAVRKLQNKETRPNKGGC